MAASASKKAVSKKKGDKKGDPNGVGDRSVEAAGRLLTYDPAGPANWLPPPLRLVGGDRQLVVPVVVVARARLAADHQAAGDCRASHERVPRASAQRGRRVARGFTRGGVPRLQRHRAAARRRGPRHRRARRSQCAAPKPPGRKESAIKSDVQERGRPRDRGDAFPEHAEDDVRAAEVDHRGRAEGVPRHRHDGGSKSVDAKMGRSKSSCVGLRRRVRGPRAVVAGEAENRARAVWCGARARCRAALRADHARVLSDVATSPSPSSTTPAFDVLKQVFSRVAHRSTDRTGALMEGGVEKLAGHRRLPAGRAGEALAGEAHQRRARGAAPVPGVQFTCEYKYDVASARRSTCWTTEP